MTARLTPGSIAPAFTLNNADGKPVSLADYSSRAVIVYFYPAAMTPGCTTQAVDFTEAQEAFTKAGYSIIGISPDTVEKRAKFTTTSDVGFTLLSDPQHSALDAYGAFGVKKLYGKEVEGVLRSTFVIDVNTQGEGTIRVAQYNVRATGHVAKVRRELVV